MLTKRTANSVNMIELLEKMNEPLKKVGKSKSWIRHPSISFLNNYWYRHSTKEKGFPVDFLMIFFNHTEQEAIRTINQYFNLQNEDYNYPSQELYRPPKNHNNQAVNVSEEVYREYWKSIEHERYLTKQIRNTWVCLDHLFDEYESNTLEIKLLEDLDPTRNEALKMERYEALYMQSIHLLMMKKIYSLLCTLKI